MTKRPVKPTTYFCYRCRWRWVPRKPERPHVCPKCHSTRWWDSLSPSQRDIAHLVLRAENAAMFMMPVLEYVLHHTADPKATAWVKKRAKHLVRYIQRGGQLVHARAPWVEAPPPPLAVLVMTRDEAAYRQWRTDNPDEAERAIWATKAEHLRDLRGEDVVIVRVKGWAMGSDEELDQCVLALIGEGAEVRNEWQ